MLLALAGFGKTMFSKRGSDQSEAFGNAPGIEGKGENPAHASYTGMTFLLVHLSGLSACTQQNTKKAR